MLSKKSKPKEARRINPAATTRGLIADTKECVVDFEDRPLANASFLLLVLALMLSVPTFIVSLVLAINNIMIAGKAGLQSGSFKFLSAGEVYLTSISTILCIVFFAAALVLLISYKVKHPVRKDGESIKWLMRYLFFSVLIMLVVAPSLLVFAENIIIIITAIVAIVIFFLLMSSLGSGSSVPSPKAVSKAKPSKAPKSSGRSVKVESNIIVFRGTSRIQQADLVWGYNPAFDSKESWAICTWSEWNSRKVRIFERGSGREITPLSRPPVGWTGN